MSISSSEGSPLPVDLPTKYQTLAAQYAKVRAQVTVLKKAVLDEQTRSAEFKELLKNQDQSLRKHDQELDSLSFRNQQLTKRVTVLQEELDKHQVANKKGRTRQDNNFTQEESKLFQEELQNRIIENASLLSQLEERNQEYERGKQMWQENLEKFNKLLLETRDAGSEPQCSCAALRSKVAALEVAASANGKHRFHSDARGPRSQQPVWPLLKKLPFLEVLEHVQLLVQLSTGTDTTGSLAKLRAVFTASSQDVALKGLQDHLAMFASLQTNVGDSDPMLKQILALLSDLERKTLRCLDVSLGPSLLEDAIESVGEVARSLRSSAIYHSSIVQETEGGARPGVLDVLMKLQASSGTLWKAITQLELDQLEAPMRENTNQLPCHQCQNTRELYQQKIDDLEKRISKMPVNKENLQSELNEPNADPDILSVVVEPLHINNEFGDCGLVPESTCRTSAAKGQMLSKYSEAIADRQLAESKLSSITTECDAARCQLEHSLEELIQQSELVSRLQEELSITTRNYEDQLSSMSEHMANMNDKLTAQQTMIEELTYELKCKDNKKGRMK